MVTRFWGCSAMRFLIRIVLLSSAAMLAFAPSSFAQQTKAQMNSYNNTNFTSNGQNQITGAEVNTMNSQMIGSMCGLAQAADCVLPPGAASGGVGPLGGVLTGTLPNPGLAPGAAAANLKQVSLESFWGEVRWVDYCGEYGGDPELAECGGAACCAGGSGWCVSFRSALDDAHCELLLDQRPRSAGDGVPLRGGEHDG